MYQNFSKNLKSTTFPIKTREFSFRNLEEKWIIEQKKKHSRLTAGKEDERKEKKTSDFRRKKSMSLQLLELGKQFKMDTTFLKRTQWENWINRYNFYFAGKSDN